MNFLDTSLKLARELLPLSTDKFCHATFIFERNKLLSIGQNNMRNASNRAAYFGRRYKLPDFVTYAFEHAEINAISKIWSKIYIDSRLRLVNVRMGRRGQLLMSKPCGNCQSVLDALGVSKVWYSTNEGFIQ